MASRMMHLAIASEICKRLPLEDPERFRLGTLLPDAYVHNIQSATDSHLKYAFANGQKKTYKLAWFRTQFADRLLQDSLYTGYYLHLIQDMVFRCFVYTLHDWDPYPKGNIQKLHNDYKLLNPYIIRQYQLKNHLIIPSDFDSEPIFSIYPFDTKQLTADFSADFLPYNNGSAFFFTQQMTDDYIKMATEKSLLEYAALQNNTSAFDEQEWSWEQNPPAIKDYK